MKRVVNFNISLTVFCLSIIPMIFQSSLAKSQIKTFLVQDFNFGNFYQGNSGGTISISIDGSRSATGDIILLNSGPSVTQAVYEIEAPVNTMISIISPTANLSDGKGGYMILEVTGSSQASFFKHTAVSPDRSTIRFSGKLTVGDKHISPPGIYQGRISITFNQE